MSTGILFIDDEQINPVGQLLESHLLLTPLLGKSLLQRAVEKLVIAGCQQIHILLGDNPSAIKAFLQQGERWGCQLHFHYAQPEESMGRLAHRLGLQNNHSYWLGCCSYIPVDRLPEPITDNLLLDQPDGESNWSGWGFMSGSWLLGLVYSRRELFMQDALAEDRTLMRVKVAQIMDASSALRLHATTQQLINLESCSRPPTTTYIHPSSTLITPVYIGAEVYVGADCIIGPNVAIEHGCYLASGSHLTDCLLLENTYVGEDLDLSRSIANGNRLCNIQTGVYTLIKDPLWLKKLTTPSRSRKNGQRILAQLLRLLLLPVFMLCKMNKRCRHGRTSGPWLTHFLDVFYPGLRHVQAGNMLLLGPTATNQNSNPPLPSSWQTLYPPHLPGLINEALLCTTDVLSPELHFASDLMACAHQNHLTITLKQLWRYLKLVLLDGLNHHKTV